MEAAQPYKDLNKCSKVSQPLAGTRDLVLTPWALYSFESYVTKRQHETLKASGPWMKVASATRCLYYLWTD